MDVNIEYSEEKNLILKATRGICFEDVIEAIENNKVVDVLRHHDRNKYPNQRVLAIKIKSYIYAVPYVFDSKRKVMFLKTVYPSRTLTKRYLMK